MTPGAWILLAAVTGALALGLWRLRTDGRFRGPQGGSRPEPGTDDPLIDDPLIDGPLVDGPAVEAVRAAGGALGERATLLQFSSAFCAPCRATRRVLGDVAGSVPGVTHVEIDAEHHLDAVRALKVVRTPTTLVLDAVGAEVTRAAGAPRAEQVLAALAGLD